MLGFSCIEQNAILACGAAPLSLTLFLVGVSIFAFFQIVFCLQHYLKQNTLSD